MALERHESATYHEAIRAIETEYRGWKFRSRLEARWAVFFDIAGIPFEYEPEGFAFDGVAYLPDFWLPKQQAWIEIKPTTGALDNGLLMSFVMAHPAGHPLWALVGTPEPPPEWGGFEDDRHECFMPHGWDNNYQFCICPNCGRVGFEWSGIGSRICGGTCGHDDSVEDTYNGRNGRLMLAYELARTRRWYA